MCNSWGWCCWEDLYAHLLHQQQVPHSKSFNPISTKFLFFLATFLSFMDVSKDFLSGIFLNPELSILEFSSFFVIFLLLLPPPMSSLFGHVLSIYFKQKKFARKGYKYKLLHFIFLPIFLSQNLWVLFGRIIYPRYLTISVPM